MGNQLALDINDSTIYCLYTLKKGQTLVLGEPKMITHSSLELNGTKYYTMNIGLHQIEDTKTMFVEDKNFLEKFVSQFIDPEDERLEIQVTGYGFDVYHELIKRFLGMFMKDFVFKKLKQIKYYGLALKYLISEAKDRFYSLKPIAVVSINQEMNESKGFRVDKTYINHEDLTKPFLVVNIKSGVSYYKVDSLGNAERISGSIIGESTYSSLIKLLTSYASAEESVEDSYRGDNRAVDMTVSDIYGGGIDSLGLPKDIIASSFGKARYLDKKSVEDKDIARSVITMVCLNIAQLTTMISDLEKLDQIVILGGMLSQAVFQQILASFIQFWSQGRKTALFPENSEVLALLGILLNNSD